MFLPTVILPVLTLPSFTQLQIQGSLTLVLTSVCLCPIGQSRGPGQAQFYGKSSQGPPISAFLLWVQHEDWVPPQWVRPGARGLGSLWVQVSAFDTFRSSTETYRAERSLGQTLSLFPWIAESRYLFPNFT